MSPPPIEEGAVKGLFGFLLIVAGAAMAIGHVVWAQWYSGILVAEHRLYSRASDGPAPAPRAIELRLAPDMNPVVIQLTGSIANVESAPKAIPLAAEFATRITRDGKPFHAGRVTLAIQPDDTGRRVEIPTGVEIVRIPTPDEGVYTLAVEPVGRGNATVTALALVIRRNVISISWGVVVAGAFLSLVGLMALRNRPDAG